MSKQVKVIELGKIKLTKGGKYIFLLSPNYYDDYAFISGELERLIGREQFTLLAIDKEAFTALEVLPTNYKTQEEV